MQNNNKIQILSRPAFRTSRHLFLTPALPHTLTTLLHLRVCGAAVRHTPPHAGQDARHAPRLGNILLRSTLMLQAARRGLLRTGWPSHRLPPARIFLSERKIQALFYVFQYIASEGVGLYAGYGCAACQGWGHACGMTAMHQGEGGRHSDGRTTPCDT